MTNLYDYILANIEFISHEELERLLKEHDVNCLVRSVNYKFPSVAPEEIKKILINEYSLT